MKRRNEILVAARDVFLAEGLEGLTMRKVASRVGISAPALYRHFASKDALLATVVDEGYRVFSRYLLEALEAPTPLERLAAVGRHYLRFALEQRDYYRLIFLSWNQLERERHRGVKHPTQVAPTFQLLVDRISECLASGELEPRATAFELAVLLFSQCHGLASLYLTGGLSEAFDEAAFEAMAQKVLDTLLGALAPASDEPTPEAS